jgi:hypothetical protein
MAVFLAAYALDAVQADGGLCAQLEAALAPAGSARVERLGRIAVAYLDLKLWPGGSAQGDGRQLIVVGGDPVICREDQLLQRSAAIAALADDLQQGLLDALGTFAGVHIDHDGLRLRAFTDKLGVRPIYWARSASHLYIASAFWLLEGLDDLNPAPDWQAAAETAAFGFPLGNRSSHASISVLEPGHLLQVLDCAVQAVTYWDWSSLPPNTLSEQALLTHVEEAFHAAVDRRSQDQSAVLCFLSGGMDSRLIAVRLRETGKQVHSLNFAPEGSQDLVLGRLIADRLGCQHFEYPNGNLGFVERQAGALKAWNEINSRLTEPLERPALIWSGDGGSVGLGHVYLNQDIIAQARRSGLSAAAKALQAKNSNFMMPSILRRQWRHLADLPLNGIEADLRARPQVEPGRNCHLFLMLNDQRRHLARHFETLHKTRIDLVLPFFDARFLAAVLTSPVDEFLDHSLYNELMARLPFGAGRVPWQTYPGHLPCPVPVDPDLRHQWDDGWIDADGDKHMRSGHLQRIGRELSHSRSVRKVLVMPMLRLLIWAERLGIGRYGYLVNAAEPFLNAAKAADRRDAARQSLT